MSKFNGKNDLQSSRALMIERARYKLDAWGPNSPIGMPEQIVNFNYAERNRYGKMDQNRNPIIPKREFLQPISSLGSSPTTLLLMNFVAKAFGDLKERMVKACRLGIIKSNHPFLSSIVAQRAYKTPMSEYEDYMNLFMGNYNGEYLPALPDSETVISFDEYWKTLVHYFIDFYDRLGNRYCWLAD